MIISAINLNFSRCQNNTVMQPIEYSPEEIIYCKKIGFNYFLLQNCEDLTYLINKVV